ncbi:MAG: magnesium-transporting ATPase [Firmicutes bacterium]|nr:magnesium-transporting ATPase [Bacillota bacterium]
MSKKFEPQEKILIKEEMPMPMERASFEGLTQAEVQERVLLGQVNRMPDTTTRTFKEIFRANVFTPFNAILSSLLAVVLLVGAPQDALFGFVLVINSMIGIIQEMRAKWTLDRLSLINAPVARVIREGMLQEVELGEVVLDDLVELRPGDQVVADGVVLASDGLEVDESMLTGESMPVAKVAGDALLSGSYSLAGSCSFRITKIGADSYAQKLASEAKGFNISHSELYEGINRILRWITWLLVPAAIFLFQGQLRADLPLNPAIVGTVAGIVGMIPQGLVLLTSVAFAVSVITLGRRNVLVNELPAVEGLARVDVLCLDKTGTLTDGKLTLDRIVKLIEDVQTETALGALCASSSYKNPTLAAISEAFPEAGDWTAHETIPFSSHRKWSAASFAEHGNWFLGAPEMLLGGKSADPGLTQQISSFTESGFRVLLLARSSKWPEPGASPAQLSPAALVLLNERVRDDAPGAMRYFARQGVTIKVISGDSPATAAHVAGRAGIKDIGEPFDSRFLPEDIDSLADIMEKHTVFGRVTPFQKQRMVEALHSKGHVVAMTGDGVNDVLALKDADIGIAMGSGVAATRSIANIVLLDGKFSSLPGIVAEGRRLIANIERVANLFLTKTVYIIFILAAVGIFGLPFPFLPRHLTLNSELTIGIPAFFMALAPNLTRYKPGFVARVLRFVFPVGAIIAVSALTTFIMAQNSPGATLEESMTVTTLVLVSISMWVVVILSRPLTRFMAGFIATMLALLGVVYSTPFLRYFFALTVTQWVVFVLAGLIILTAVFLIEAIWRLVIKKNMIK